MSKPVALVPVKSESDRVPDKNLKPFVDGASLAELKILNLLVAGFDVVVSSNDVRAEQLAVKYNVKFQRRPDVLCEDKVDLGELLRFCLAGYEDKPVYWAHVTSPLVRIETMQNAINLVDDDCCVLGVEKRQDFLWRDEVTPFNYDPYVQPRSQDLDVLYRVTGGIHMAMGHRFMKMEAVSFVPAVFVHLGGTEAIDIDNEPDWFLAGLVYKRQ
jgi:CMP-N-acetylneuraminic acid synthetase